eukprot:CAMPEP_0170184938 /NCGR_PEP_ID=MMETSP0040_2-20121228/35128_1 /TAXON_ID=641309 /ORGANISM="Lotharella oceanica, Strain CCMP622" /LENGTH=145 /DNA_ID=CAMNT_0010431159 /DNA_START=1 /DNA_END=438 /DNA_ORIENTATION=-
MKAIETLCDNCETGKGWDKCKEFCTKDCTFVSQAGPLANIKTFEAYTNWMAGMTKIMPGSKYEIMFSGWDAARKKASIAATFSGTHSVTAPPEAKLPPATNKSTTSHYSYILEVGEDGKVKHVTKIWNAFYSAIELGWAKPPQQE